MLHAWLNSDHMITRDGEWHMHHFMNMIYIMKICAGVFLERAKHNAVYHTDAKISIITNLVQLPL